MRRRRNTIPSAKSHVDFTQNLFIVNGCFFRRQTISQSTNKRKQWSWNFQKTNQIPRNNENVRANKTDMQWNGCKRIARRDVKDDFGCRH